MELRVQKEVTPFLRISAASGSELGLKLNRARYRSRR
jgi:hypothetical protein